jgi:hypothetical protein
MTDLEQQLTDHLRRRAAAATPRYDLEGIEQHTDLASLVDLDHRRSRAPTIRLLAIAACLLAVVALAAIVTAERQAVDTTDPSNSPTQTTTSEAAADGPTTLAKGEAIELVGGPSSGLGNQTLNIDAVEENGEVTGEFWVSEVVTRVDCAATDTDGIVSIGGEVTTGAPGFIEVGDLQALIIREGDPDSVSLYANDAGAESCNELLESIPDADALLDDPTAFVPVEDGYDIETG